MLWYQGENNQIFSGGNETAGYLCQQNALISSWRAAFSATAGTTAPDVPFGVTSLAGGGGEGFPLWSPALHATEEAWRDCFVRRLRTPACLDISDDSMGLLRRAQAGGAGFFATGSKVFLGQAHDLGEPCQCDTRAPAPHGCWANGECWGAGPFSLNLTHNYEMSGIHPRPKLQIGQRLALGFRAVEAGVAAPVAKLAGCRLGADGALTLVFDAALLRGEAVRVQTGAPGLLPLEVRAGPPTNVSSGWVRALSLRALNESAVAVGLPPGLPPGAPDAVRYAWANTPCCPGLLAETFFCPPEACPLSTPAAAGDATSEPAVPFFALIVGGRCECEAPWDCSA